MRMNISFFKQLTLVYIISVTILVNQSAAGENDIVFSYPVANTVHFVGDTVLVQFDMPDTSIHLTKNTMSFSNNNGKDWIFLPVALNGVDSVSVKKHYNWIIPDSMHSGTKAMSTLGDACMIKISTYDTKQVMGTSSIFMIRNRSANILREALHSVNGSPELLGQKGNMLLNFTGKAPAGGALFFATNGKILPAFTKQTSGTAGKASMQAIVITSPTRAIRN